MPERVPAAGRVGIALSSDSDEELDASGPEGPKRFDPNCPQGKSYTRQQFIVAYGGAAEWDAAGMTKAPDRRGQGKMCPKCGTVARSNRSASGSNR